LLVIFAAQDDNKRHKRDQGNAEKLVLLLVIVLVSQPLASGHGTDWKTDSQTDWLIEVWAWIFKA